MTLKQRISSNEVKAGDKVYLWEESHDGNFYIIGDPVPCTDVPPSDCFYRRRKARCCQTKLAIKSQSGGTYLFCLDEVFTLYKNSHDSIVNRIIEI